MIGRGKESEGERGPSKKGLAKGPGIIDKKERDSQRQKG